MNIRASLPAIILAGLILSCTSPETVTIPNQPPTISFGVARIGTARGVPVNLSVSVDDPDDDPLTVTWEITRGTLTPQNTSNTLTRWAVPVALGVDTVTVTVSDGEDSATTTEEIVVATMSAGASALASYIKANSPYIIAPASGGIPTLVAPVRGQNAATVVEAGVEFLINAPETRIIVEGEMELNGTEQDPVIIRPNNRNLRCQDGRGWWEGFNVTTANGESVGGVLTTNYAEITYAESNVRLTLGGDAVLNNSSFRCALDAGVRHSGSGSLTVSNSEISNNATNGIEIAAITSLPTSVDINNCYIAINNNAGLFVDINDLGVAVPISVEFNLFEFNIAHGVFLSRASFPAIHNNHFQANGGGASNIWLDTGFPGGASVDTLLATDNYWGAAFSSQAAIDASIRDTLDDGSVNTRVWVNPWVNTSPLP